MARTSSRRAGLSASTRDNWETPDYIVARLAAFAGVESFDLDVAAMESNRKAAFCLTVEQDGLVTPWRASAVWCNPPYGRGIKHWAQAARRNWSQGNFAVLVMLLPATSTDTGWFHQFILPYTSQVVLFSGRISFELQGVPFKGSDISNMAVVMRRGRGTEFRRSVITVSAMSARP